MFGCKSQQQNSGNSVAGKPPVNEKITKALPHVVIYKTKKDYNRNVPVTLSEDKTQIVAYPHPTDLIFNGNLALPTQLNNGYMLDNRGITKNVAFLKYTYDEYSKLKDVPSMRELQRAIIDEDPLVELWDCGEKKNFTDLQKQLNEWIDGNLLSGKSKQIK